MLSAANTLCGSGGIEMLSKDWKKEFLTIPNLLSLFRLLLIPVYVTLYLRAEAVEDYCIAAGVLAVSCLTDLIDGKIARHFNMISTVGKILDPFADKATQFTLIVCLAIRNPVLWTLVTLFVIKEGFQLIAGLLTLRKGQMLSGATLPGKICTTVLFLSLIVMVLQPDLESQIISVITAVDCVFMITSFVSYAMIYFTHSPMIQDLDPSKEDNA